MKLGIILYGPPASGKDTVTAALRLLDSRYRLFQRLKVGPGRTEGYRMTTDSDLAALRATGQLLWENRRYGAVYAVDRPGVIDELARHIPVVHLGQVEAVDAIRSFESSTRWIVVALWCPRVVAEERARARSTGDLEDRMRAWDQTQPLDDADLYIDTATHTPDQAALRIHQAASRQSTRIAG